eukprot:s809_g4.t1
MAAARFIFGFSSAEQPGALSNQTKESVLSKAGPAAASEPQEASTWNPVGYRACKSHGPGHSSEFSLCLLLSPKKEHLESGVHHESFFIVPTLAQLYSIVAGAVCVRDTVFGDSPFHSAVLKVSATIAEASSLLPKLATTAASSTFITPPKMAAALRDVQIACALAVNESYVKNCKITLNTSDEAEIAAMSRGRKVSTPALIGSKRAARAMSLVKWLRGVRVAFSFQCEVYNFVVVVMVVVVVVVVFVFVVVVVGVVLAIVVVVVVIDVGVVVVIGARAEESVTALEPRGLAMLAHSAAKLGWKDIGVLTALASCASAKASDLTSTDLAKICWAFSKLDVVDELPSFWQTMTDNVRAKASTAKSVDLSMLAWAFGNCELRESGYLSSYHGGVQWDKRFGQKLARERQAVGGAARSIACEAGGLDAPADGRHLPVVVPGRLPAGGQSDRQRFNGARSRLASTMPALALRAAALFCAARWTRDANLPDGRRLIDELSSLPEPYSALGELLGGTTRASGEVNGAAHAEGYGEFAELGGLLGAALRSGSPGNPAQSLGAVESFASSCRHLNAFLGPRAAILDEFTARLPQLVVEIGG